jgi:4-amino-4-deoxy-L-arabinose transferase-like glycosyltransferase
MTDALSLIARRPAVAIAIFAFAVRGLVLAVSWQGAGEWNRAPDSNRYLALADAFVEGKGLSLADAAGIRRPEYLTLPTYPLLLAGFRALGTESVLPALIVQCLATSLAAAALSFMVATTIGPAAGILSAVLQSLDFQSVAYSSMLLTDALSLAFITFALATLVGYAQRRSLLLAWATGLWVAAAVFTRPANVVLLLIAAVGMVAVSWARQPWRSMLSHVGLMLCVASLPVLAWSAHNHARSGMWFYSTSPDVVLVRWQLPHLYAEAKGTSLERAREIIASELDIEDTYTTLGVRPPEFRQRARTFSRELVAAHPATFLRLYLAGVVRVAAQPDASITQVLGRPVTESGLAQGAIGRADAFRARWNELGWGYGLLYFLQLPYLGAVYVLGLLGAFRGFTRPETRRVLVVCILGAAVFILISGGYPGDPRYRLPALPFLIVLAGLGVIPQAKMRTMERQAASPPRAAAES